MPRTIFAALTPFVIAAGPLLPVRDGRLSSGRSLLRSEALPLLLHYGGRLSWDGGFIIILCGSRRRLFGGGYGFFLRSTRR